MRAGQRNFPEFGIELRELAGGLLAYSGVSGALSQAVAVGIECEVSADIVDEITQFYRMRGATPRVTVSPLNHPTLGSQLARSGYVPGEYVNALIANLDALKGEHDHRITEVIDVEQWADASVRGFGGEAEPGEVLRKTSLLLATSGATALEAREGNAVIATACCAFEGDGVVLFAGSTVPAYRRQGWQRAMIRERIARAKDAGMRFARVGAVPLSDSERNLRALGFIPLYTRVTWELSG